MENNFNYSKREDEIYKNWEEKVTLSQVWIKQKKVTV